MKNLKKNLLESISGMFCGAVIIVPMMIAYWVQPLIFG